MLKNILIAIPILLILIVAAAIATYKYVGDEFIEAQALYQLERILSRKVTIDGHFSLARTAQPTLSASNIRIASAHWDPGNYLVEAKEVTIKINSTPLLFGILSIEEIIFNKGQLNIVVNEEGVSNLDIGNTLGKSFGLNIYRPLVNKVEMLDLSIQYENHQKKTQYEIYSNKVIFEPIDDTNEKIEVAGRFTDQEIEISGKMCRWSLLFDGGDCHISALVRSSPFEAKISGDLSIKDKGYIDLNFDISGKNINELKLPFDTYLPDTKSAQTNFNLSGELNAIELSRLESNLTFIGSTATIKGSIKSLNSLDGVKINIYAEGTNGKWLDQYQDYFPGELIDHYTFSSVLENHEQGWILNNIESSTKMEETQLVANGDIIIGASDLSVNMNINGHAKQPEWINHLQETIDGKHIDDIKFDFDLVDQNNTWSIGNLRSTVLTEDHTLTANGNINFPKEESVKIELDINSLGRNLRSLAKIVKLELPESQKFNIKTKLKYQQPTLTLSESSVSIDNNKVTGYGEIDFIKPPNIRAELKANSLNVANIFALFNGKKENTSEKKSTGKQALFSDEPLDLDWLENADTNISLIADKITYKDAELKHLKARLRANEGIGQLTVDRITYYNSELNADFNVSTQSNSHTYNIKTESFNIGKFFKETETTNLLTGEIDFYLDMNSTGRTTKQLAENASGEFIAFVKDGTLHHDSVDKLATSLLSELLPGEQREPHTVIECFFTKFKGDKGLMESEAILLNTKYMVMTGNGKINLGKEEYDLRLIPKPKNLSLFTLDSDILVTGHLTDPQFTISKGSLIYEILQSAAAVALGPAALSLSFTSTGSTKYQKCFEEVAESTKQALEAEQKKSAVHPSDKKGEDSSKPGLESSKP